MTMTMTTARPNETSRPSTGRVLFGLAGATALVALAFFSACQFEPAPVRQPLAFNHAIHVGKRDIPCTDCHVGAENDVHAGLPSLSRCLLCHMRPQPQGEPPSEREPIVRKLAAEGAKIRWNRVTRNPGHVYFSHRAHVGFAEMECNVCHGDMKSAEHSLTRPNISHLTMRACIACHAQKSVSNDCVTCHQ